MRKVFFWLHLTAGTIAGVVILIMSVTGVLLMYEWQMIAWADRNFRSTPSAGVARMAPEELIAKLLESEKAAPATLTVYSDSGAPVEAAFGRERTVYLDAYSGRVLGEGAKSIRTFFHVVTDWHRYLAAAGENRALGRAITGACNLAFLFLVCSGMYIWLPRKWKWQSFRSVLFFRGGLSGKTRDFNWHNVIGIWSAVPLFFIVLGGVMISYPWATNLLYKVTGSEAPATPSRPPGRPLNGGTAAAPADLTLAGLNNAWARAEQHMPGWQSISLRLPNSNRAPYAFTVAESHRGRPDKRSSVTIHRRTGEVLQAESFASFNLGRRMRMWLRFLHTGEALGLAGQTIAGLVSAGGAVLVWTGIALAWRRFRAWRGRKQAQIESRDREGAVMQTPL